MTAATIPLRRATTAGKLGYSVGNLGKSIVWTSFDTFLLYYLVRIAGMAPLAAGGLLSAILVWDGCADVAVAYLADRHGRADALGRLILVGAPICAGSFWLIFALPPVSWPPAIVAAVVACRIGYTLCDIGHNTLLVRLAVTPRDATTVSGMRLIFSALGAGLVGLAASAILSDGPVDRDRGFAAAAAVGGIVYLATLMTSVHATRHLPAPAPAPVIRAPDRRTTTMVGTLWRNATFRLVLCLIAVQASLIPLFNRALPFIGEATHGGADWAGTALAIITAAQALSLPAWMAFAGRRSSAAILAIAYAIIIAAICLLAVRSGGLADAIGLALLGIAQAGMNMAIWALLALGLRDGGTSEALPIGLFLAVLKGSAGLGSGLFATAIASGSRWCPSCIGHEAGPVMVVATAFPVLGCVIGLTLIARNRALFSESARRPS